jgi:hypothetical protein
MDFYGTDISIGKGSMIFRIYGHKLWHILLQIGKMVNLVKFIDRIYLCQTLSEMIEDLVSIILQFYPKPS